jgi:hypothetical protein
VTALALGYWAIGLLGYWAIEREPRQIERAVRTDWMAALQ